MSKHNRFVLFFARLKHWQLSLLFLCAFLLPILTSYIIDYRRMEPNGMNVIDNVPFLLVLFSWIWSAGNILLDHTAEFYKPIRFKIIFFFTICSMLIFLTMLSTDAELPAIVQAIVILAYAWPYIYLIDSIAKFLRSIELKRRVRSNECGKEFSSILLLPFKASQIQPRINKLAARYQ